MEPPTRPDRPTTSEIDEQYSEIDPDDVTENAIDYFQGRPETETEKSEDHS